MSVMIISELQFCAINNALNKYRLDNLLASEREALVTSWFEMNQFEYGKRYNESTEAYKPNYRENEFWGSPDKVGTLKLMESLRYNLPTIDELKEMSGIPLEWRNASEALEHHINRLKNEIISDLTDYEKQPWVIA